MNADKSQSSQPPKDSEKSKQVENEKEDNENLDLDSDMVLPEVRFYPGISYFICFSQTDGCHPDRFAQCLQQRDMDMDVSPIQVRLRSTESTHTDDNGKLTESVSDWSDKEKHFVFGDRMQCEKFKILI